MQPAHDVRHLCEEPAPTSTVQSLMPACPDARHDTALPRSCARDPQDTAPAAASALREFHCPCLAAQLSFGSCCILTKSAGPARELSDHGPFNGTHFNLNLLLQGYLTEDQERTLEAFQAAFPGHERFHTKHDLLRFLRAPQLRSEGVAPHVPEILQCGVLPETTPNNYMQYRTSCARSFDLKATRLMYKMSSHIVRCLTDLR